MARDGVPGLAGRLVLGRRRGIKRDTAGVWLLFHAADLASDTLREVCEIEFPVCTAHGGDPMTPDWEGEERVAVIDEVVWWRCSHGDHALAPVGQLTTEAAKALGYDDLRSCAQK